MFAHVLSVFGFLLGHGTSAAVAFALRREREAERIRVLLDLSRTAGGVANAALLVLAAGVTAGFMGGWWGQGWIWAALAALILISIGMFAAGSGPLVRIRQLVGATGPRHARTKVPAVAALDAAGERKLAALCAAIHPWLLTAIGGGGLAAILWLMLFKPF